MSTTKYLLADDVVLQRFSHYKTGIEQYDTEHIELIFLFSRIDISQPEEHLQVAYRHAVNCLLSHWNDESYEMRIIGYPNIDYHDVDHRDRSKTLRCTAESILIRKYECNQAINMILDHIDQYDIPYAQWLLKYRKLSPSITNLDDLEDDSSI